MRQVWFIALGPILVLSILAIPGVGRAAGRAGWETYRALSFLALTGFVATFWWLSRK
jgi:hypothetical protein